jgi:hypothetical protein
MFVKHSTLNSSGSQPGVREELTGGTPNFKNHSTEVYLGRIFDLGVRRGVQS